MTDYPQWVRERACELAMLQGAARCHPENVGLRNNPLITALADLILKYETAPVDPAVAGLQSVAAFDQEDAAQELVDVLRKAGFDIVKVQP